MSDDGQYGATYRANTNKLIADRGAAELLATLRERLELAFAAATEARDDWSSKGRKYNSEHYYIGKREGLALALSYLERKPSD